MSNFLEKIKYGISEVASAPGPLLPIIVFSVMDSYSGNSVFSICRSSAVKIMRKIMNFRFRKSKEIEGTRGNIYDRNGNLSGV